MPVLLREDYEYPLPKMFRVRQIFDDQMLDDYIASLAKELEKTDISMLIRPQMSVAVAVGSRGINHIREIVKYVIDYLIRCDAKPFIVSAMGSHGGGTRDGQKEVLASYGITEDFMGVPVVTDVESVEIGTLSDGQIVYFDKCALEADMIIPINRIKLHTDFSGELQSGLSKMLVIGLGNQKGCSAMHEVPPEGFAVKLEEAARLILDKASVGFGIGIMENAYDETCHIEAIRGDRLIEREKELVKKCASLMPYINIQKADILIVDEIGKDISGAGFDPNILGRSTMLKKFLLPIPKFQKMILGGITLSSHGNAIGIGFFDIILEKICDEIDYEAMYTNAAAVRSIEDVRIPLKAGSMEEAVRIAAKVCRGIDLHNLRIIRIKNTLSLATIEVSEALASEISDNEKMIIVGDGRQLADN